MRKFFVVPAVIAVATLVSCQKQQTEAEKNAEVERQVQERLAAEHQAEQQQQLQQQQADLDAREKALAEKENAAAATPARRERAEPEPVTRARAVSGAGPTSGYSTFYTKLEPHGAWLETADYGYVWQPREAESSRSWRPYTNGRWVYTDAGWTWISEEPFGWATYHYGRWTRLRGIGWVWVPGQQWAPAWVSWRKSNDYVGWAPLPPEARFDQRTGIHNWSDNYYDIGPDQYCFVATREFGAQRAESTILPPERNVAIVNQTTNVTNITYNNTTIVNEGPNYDEVRAQSREPMQRFRLERNASVDLNVEAPRPLVQGETVIVAAPVISAPQASERPRAVKQNITQVTVDLGWAAIGDHEAAKKARDKMKAEATPPSNAPSKKFVKAAATTTTASQGAETPASSTSVTATPLPSAAISATPAPTAVATSTPETKITPRRVIPSEPSPTPAATSTPVSSASPLPTASQRRGRLPVPSATPPPRTTPSATPKLAASTSPAASDTVSSGAIPAPSASLSPTTGASQTEATRGKFESQAQKFNPRKVEPMSSPSQSPAVTSTPMPDAASAPSIFPGGKLTKQEKKEQKREEKKELRRERKEGTQPGTTPSPSATP
ncbi:MAG: hypothetical protein DMF18_06730 [Verrucomicrobia bacterium]|nr:MAG: hypothetical protein DME73_06875 [Verrucomicrobiota bacterium]PYL96144.1 MAG: hypothetical protein DMF18_06730 [Verrucomicrobiota bacterium]